MIYRKMKKCVGVSIIMLITVFAVIAFMSVDVDAASKLGQVKNVRAGAHTTSVLLSWSEVKGAKTYEVYQKKKTWSKWKKTSKKKHAKFKNSPKKYKVKKSGKKYYYKKSRINYVVVDTVKEAWTRIGKLKVNTKYAFKIRAVKGKQKGKFSKAKTITTQSKPKKGVPKGNTFDKLRKYSAFWNPTPRMLAKVNSFKSIRKNNLDFFYGMDSCRTLLAKLISGDDGPPNGYNYKGHIKYKYKIYELYDINAYTDTEKLFYIKTDNPNPDTFSVSGVGSNGWDCNMNVTRKPFLDVRYTDKSIGKVPGGYLASSEMPKESGTRRYVVREKTDSIKVTYFDSDQEVVLKNREIGLWTTVDSNAYSINVLDAKEEAQKFRKRVIKEIADPAYSERFKNVSRIRNWFLDNAYYPRVKVDGKTIYLWQNSEGYELTSNIGINGINRNPVYGKFISNSYSSPLWLAAFGKDLGIPTLRSMYWDFPVGSGEWMQKHDMVTDYPNIVEDHPVQECYPGYHFWWTCPTDGIPFNPQTDMVDFTKFK